MAINNGKRVSGESINNGEGVVKAKIIPSDLASQLTIIRGRVNTTAGKYRQGKHDEGRAEYARFMAEAVELGKMLGY